MASDEQKCVDCGVEADMKVNGIWLCEGCLTDRFRKKEALKKPVSSNPHIGDRFIIQIRNEPNTDHWHEVKYIYDNYTRNEYTLEEVVLLLNCKTQL